FFFQAEDGIRDGHVTGVQTCALPICARARATADQRSPRPRTVRAVVPSRHHRVLPDGHDAAPLAVLGVARVPRGALGGVPVLTAVRARLGAVPARGPGPASLPRAASRMGAPCGARDGLDFLRVRSDARLMALKCDCQYRL